MTVEIFTYSGYYIKNILEDAHGECVVSFVFSGTGSPIDGNRCNCNCQYRGAFYCRRDGRGEDFSCYPDWQQDSIKEALDVIENWDGYIELPDKWDINEYNIMEEFCLSIKNEKLSDKLYYVIKGRGAFRRFKGEIIQYGIEEDWYNFRDEALKGIAIRWCNANEIVYNGI